MDRKRLRHRWLADAEALNRDRSYEAYAVPARRIGITDVLHIEVDGAEADMADCGALHVVPDAVSQSGLFRENIARLGAAGLPFDIVVLARQLPLAQVLADACPDTIFV